MLSLLKLSSACVCQALQPSTPTAAVVLSVLFSFLACQPEVLAWLSESQPWISSYVTLTVLNRILVQRAAAPSIGHDTCTDCSSPDVHSLADVYLKPLWGKRFRAQGLGFQNTPSTVLVGGGKTSHLQRQSASQEDRLTWTYQLPALAQMCLNGSEERAFLGVLSLGIPELKAYAMAPTIRVSLYNPNHQCLIKRTATRYP